MNHKPYAVNPATYTRMIPDVGATFFLNEMHGKVPCISFWARTNPEPETRLQSYMTTQNPKPA